MLVRLLFLLAALVPAVLAQNTYPDCKNGPLAGTPACDASLPHLTRAKYITSLMNVTEKAIRLQNGSPALERLGLPAYQWWSEALHGVAYSPGVSFADSGPFRCATSFPEPIGLGATYDRELIHTLASVTSDEARAFNNAGRAGLDFWTPNINIFRDPRWGRGQETPGEDPYLSSEYVFYLINGYQRGEDSRYYKIVADCKHYAGYDVEHWHGIDRYSYNAIISNQDLVETYLPSFKSCMKDAKVGSAMCSYNAVNGVPACANDLFMNQIARGRWDWEGWITSDCGAISGIYDGHHYVSNHSAQVQVALRAGCDIGCDSALSDYAEQAVKDGSITEADLDLALTRQWSSLIQLGYFDDAASQPYRQYGEDKVHTANATAIAHRAARESLVLLKNDGTLPWDMSAVNTVAVIGPNANNTDKQIGNYNGKACFMHTVTDGLQAMGVKVLYAQGCAINDTNTSGFKAALTAAQAADAIVFVGGLDNSLEAEGLDRDFIDFPGQQSPLIEQLGQLGKPLVLVLFGGGGVDVTAERDSKAVGAIIHAGYPSQSGGEAIAEAVFGHFSPAGRSVTTWYPKDYVNQVPLTDQAMRPNSTSGNPGRTYKFYTGEPVFPFGHGLTYTRFDFETIEAPAKSLAISDLVNDAMLDDRSLSAASWTVNVTNVGEVTSDVVVLAFLASTASFPSVTPPIKELYDYARLHDMAPGESRTVILGLSYRVFSHVDEQGHAWLLPGKYRLAIDNEEHVTAEFTLHGEPTIIESSPLIAEQPVAPFKRVRKSRSVIN